MSLKVLKDDTKLYAKISDTLKKSECLQNAFEALDDNNVFDMLEFGSNLTEVITNISKLQAVSKSFDNTSRILKDISSKTSDPNLKTACSEFSLYIDETLGGITYALKTVLEDTIFELTDYLIDKVWDLVGESFGPAGLVIKGIDTGRKIGKLASNMLFSTEALIEHYYAMLALYEFGNTLDACVQTYRKNYLSNKTYENAFLFNDSFILLAKTVIEGSEYAEKYYEITYEEGVVGFVNNIINMYNNASAWFNNLFGGNEEPPKRDYQTLIETIGKVKSQINGLVDFIKNDSYNCFLDNLSEKFESVNYDYIPKKITSEQVVEYTTDIQEVSTQYSNRYFKSSTKLDDDITVYGNAYISASVDLNGHKLNIMGDLIQTSGELTINGGMLNVYGDYRLQKETINANGEIKYSSAYARLVMNNEADTVNIAGSFITRSDRTHTLTAGTMKVGGDIYDWGNIQASSNGKHKVVLNGTKKQTVYFSSSYSYFNILELTQPSSNYKCWNKLITAMPVEVKSHSLLIGDGIGVNFYMNISSDILENDTAEIRFTVNGKEITVSVSDAETTDGMYMFTCPVAAAEINDIISAQLYVDGEKTGDSFTYSVRTYADFVLENPDDYSKEIDLINAMLNYGATAEKYFTGSTEMNSTPVDITAAELEAYRFDVTDNDPAIDFAGQVITLNSKVTAKLYFRGAELTSGNFSVTQNGRTIGSSRIAVDTDADGTYLAITGIHASDMSKPFVKSVGGVTIRNYSVYSYIESALNSREEGLPDVAAALYRYGCAAEEYINNAA